MVMVFLQTIKENNLVEHRVMLPPGNHGRVTKIAPAGEYTIQVRTTSFLEPRVSHLCQGFYEVAC